MIDWLLGGEMLTQFIIREWMNAVSFGMFTCLAWRFVRVIRESPNEPKKHEAAIALFVVCFGELMRSAWAWLALAAQNKHWSIFPAVQQAYEVGIAAAFTITIGALCCLRVFQPLGSGFGSQIWAIVFTAGCLILTMLL